MPSRGQPFLFLSYTNPIFGLDPLLDFHEVLWLIIYCPTHLKPQQMPFLGQPLFLMLEQVQGKTGFRIAFADQLLFIHSWVWISCKKTKDIRVIPDPIDDRKFQE